MSTDTASGIGAISSLHPVIHQLRRERQKRCTQAQMARMAGTSRGNIADWEYGRYSPTLAHLTDWANALGFDLALVPKERTDAAHAAR